MNNEPAFPITDTYHPNGQVQFGSNGITIRDYFAAKALSGLMTRVWNEDGKMSGNELIVLWAKSAYACADAMLAERNKPNV